MRKYKFSSCMIVLIVYLTGCANNPIYTSQSVITKVDDQIILSVLAGQSSTDAGIEDMIDEMMEDKHPNIKLEWEIVEWGDKFYEQLQYRVAAGDVPDIMIGKAQDIPRYALDGLLAPIDKRLTEYIDEDAKLVVSVDDIIYGLPYNASYQGVFYQRELFDELNLEIPETLEELEVIVDTLEKANVTPFASHYEESWSVGNMTMQFFLNNIFNENEHWGDDFRSEKIHFSDNEGVIDCYEQSYYVFTNSWEDAFNVDQYESDRRFEKGEAAMYLTGTWSMQYINQYGSTGGYGLFPYPNRTGNANLIRETNLTFMKSKLTNHSEEVNQVFEELLSNKSLMTDILDFTRTYSVIGQDDLLKQGGIEEDIQKYESDDRIIEACVGNRQLIWAYQNELALQELLWLRGEKTLYEVLAYADQNRSTSGL